MPAFSAGGCSTSDHARAQSLESEFNHPSGERREAVSGLGDESGTYDFKVTASWKVRYGWNGRDRGSFVAVILDNLDDLNSAVSRSLAGNSNALVTE